MNRIRTVPLILLGMGGVGRAFVRQVVASRRRHAERFAIHLQVTALMDSGGAVVEPRGLDDDTLLALERAKAQGASLARTPLGYLAADAQAIVDVAGADDAIVVDCTASEKVIPALEMALDRGYGVVLANKKPLAGPLSLFRRLTASRRLRHEATVGAGTPVVAALEALIRGGDDVSRIVAALSGTLGFLMSELQAGRLFSAAVRQAHALGYTEPDPRDDLSGADVARKALILARMLGWELEMADVHVEPLYPQSLAEGNVEQFLAGLEALDQPFAASVREARERSEALRYVATLADGQCAIGVRAVPFASPLGRLTGNDNLVEFHTRWYTPNPLVLQGRGAGADATAAGVLADVIALAQCMG